MTQINQNNIQNTSTTPQEAIKTKIALKKPQSKEQPLKRKFENKGSFNFSQKQQIPIIEQNYILMPPKQARPALK